MLEKKVFIGMNKDASAKDLRPEEYRHAENLVAVTDGVGVSTRLENMLGMRETGMPVQPDAVCVGLWNYREGNKIYGFYSSATLDSIIEYDGIRDEATVLMQNNLLGFDVSLPVHDVFLIENLLYFNDGRIDGSGHQVRKINIDYAKTGALNDISDERALSLIKTPPLKWITQNRLTDETLTFVRPKIREIPLQFATRYVYDDDEISVLSPISHVAPALDWDVSDNQYNYVEVVFHIDVALAPIIRKVELLVREKNDGLWYVYDSRVPEDFTIDNLDGTKSLEYDCYLDRSGGTLSEEEAGSSSESVPRISGGMELMENRLFLTSTLEEFDINEDDWSCYISVKTNANAKSNLDDVIYFPQYYKENSKYTFGIVFMDDFGRKTAPVVRTQMIKTMPDNFTDYTVINYAGDIFTFARTMYSHPDGYRVSPVMSGKPPPWATKYQFARTENETYIDWFKGRFIIKPLYSPNKQTEEPAAYLANIGIYKEGDYWYWSIEYMLHQFHDGAITEDQISWQTRYFDLVIPDGLPIGVDTSSIVKLAFDLPKNDSGGALEPYRTSFAVIEVIDNNKLRVKGLSWIDMKTVFYDERDVIAGEILPTGRPVLLDDQILMHFEILNPAKKVETPLMYEIGKVYDVVNAGTDARAFQVNHNFIYGDCYYSAYHSAQGLLSGFTDVVYDIRIGREDNSVSYALLSPIADPDRAGSPIKLDEEGNPIPTDPQSGLYWDYKADGRGRVTVEVPNQKELKRGNQVRFSRTFIQDSLVNGLSNFPEENKHATSSDRGDIVKLVSSNERVLVAVHTRSITSLYINQRFINSGEGAAFLAQTDSVIGDDRKLLLNYGTQHPESVITHDSRVYGFDSIMSEPWRRSQDGITPLALTFGMKTYFEEKGEAIRRVRTLDPAAVITVLGGYDQWLDMYVLTFSKIEYVDNGTPITIPAETIGFSERVKRWVSFYSFKPEYYSSIMNNLVSAENQSIWRHMDTQDRNLFYGDYYSSQITLVSMESNDIPKTYQNLGISSTSKWRMTCLLPDGKESTLELDNFVLKDNIYYANLLRDKNTPTENLKTGQIPMLHGEKLIGETMEITLINDSAEKVVLDAVYVGYSPMAGHLLSQR